ncbi:MAG: DUF4159 domain-containing protein [Planctomycetaceae bacterium]|nr:DUF4159 domain-containing protein [Planctomycetaceae bacterium]
MFTPSRLSAQPAPNEDVERRTRVLQSIKRAQDFLISQQSVAGNWNSSALNYDIGVPGLVTLALMNSGLPPDHPAVAKSLDYLRKKQDPDKTYEVAMLAMVLAAAGQPQDNGRLHRLAAWLEEAQIKGGPGKGAWGYEHDASWYDHSNTQFAVLGLREAAAAGVPVDRKVWERTQEHFLATQVGQVDSPSGVAWGYQEGGGTGSMTVAGIATLTITSSMLADDSQDTTPDGQIMCCGNAEDPAEKSIQAGIRWLSQNFRVTGNPGGGGWLLYYLYGLERAGRFSGRRFFGEHDWYRAGADYLVRQQNPRGSWMSESEQDAIIGTSLGLLFLSKGLSPVLINKLRYGARDASGNELKEGWNEHPRDINQLVEFISGQPRWPKLMTWQVLDLSKAASGEGVEALLQSPVQYLSGTESLDVIEGRELELLREYIAQGGFIFAVQNCDNAAFDESFRRLVQRLFDGQYELTKLPPTHDIYRSEFVFNAAPPELWGVDFGCRTAIVYAPFDHACRWQKWMKHDPPNRHVQVKTQIVKSMQLATNIIAYATGRELHDKLKRPELLTDPDQQRINRGRLSVARLRHTGGWDTAPNALRRLQIELEHVGVEPAIETPNLPATDPALFDYPLLYMHGRKNFSFSEDERRKLRQYLENGGFLFADACCGAEQFDVSFRELVEQTLEQPLTRIPSDDPIYQLPIGYDIRQVRRRIPGSAQGALRLEESDGEPVLEGVKVDGRYVVVYSRYDLSCTLERQATTSCAGYLGADAGKIAVNIVLYGLFQ